MKLAVKTDLFGDEYVDHIWAWCFENDKETDKSVLRYIRKDECYAVAGQAESEDPEVRPYHKDVYCAKQRNLEKYGKGNFKTIWEMEQEMIDKIEAARRERECSLVAFF